MNFQKAEKKHIDEIMKIYEDAVLYMRANGNYVQWKNGYPGRELVLSDIERERVFIYTDGEKIGAVFCLDYDGDPLYETITGGKWLNNEPYVIVRRIAVSPEMHHRGISSECFDFTLRDARKRKVFDIRLITHEDNTAMLKAMGKFGFKYCGLIDLKDGHPRRAYQFSTGYCHLCSLVY